MTDKKSPTESSDASTGQDADHGNLDQNTALKDTQPSQEQPILPEPQPEPLSQKKGSFAGVLSLVLVVLLGGGLGYFAHVANTYKSQTDEALKQLAEKNKAIEQAQSSLRDRLNATKKDVESQSSAAIDQLKDQQLSLQKEIKATSNTIEGIHKRLTELSPRDEQRWIISQIEYFLNMAQYRASLTDDALGAALLLEESIEVAQQLRSIEAQKLINALAQDRADLKIDSHWQPQVIHAEISTLASRVPQLSLAAYSKDTVEGENVELEIQDQKIKKFLSSLVRIQKTDERLKPMLDSTSRYRIEQHLYMLFTEAQLALMRQNQDAFVKSLNQASEVIQSAYIQTAKETKFFVDELDRLTDLKIQQEKMDFTRSHSALRNLIIFLEAQAENKDSNSRA